MVGRRVGPQLCLPGRAWTSALALVSLHQRCKSLSVLKTGCKNPFIGEKERACNPTRLLSDGPHAGHQLGLLAEPL